MKEFQVVKVTSNDLFRFKDFVDEDNNWVRFQLAKIVTDRRRQVLDMETLPNEIRYLTKEVHDFETDCHQMTLEEFREKKYDYYAKKKRLAEAELEFFAMLDADAEVEFELNEEQYEVFRAAGLIEDLINFVKSNRGSE